MKNGNVKQVFSQKLGRKVDLWVLDTPNPKGLIYMMHGNGGDCLEWEENTDIAALAAQHGMKISVQDGRIYAIIEGGDGWEQLAEEYINDYKDIPNLDSYFLQDEPIEQFFPALRRVRDKFAQLDPKHKSLVNLLPVPPVTNTEHYEIYLRRFVEEFDPEIISYDHYNLQFKEVERLTDQPEALVSEECRVANGWQDKVFEKYNRHMFMDNLEVVRQVAMEKQIPWKIILQVINCG